MTVSMKGTVEKRLKRSKQRMRKEPLNKTRMVDTLKDYSCESSIHGIQYLGNSKHSTCGRGFWLITVCIALICTLVQVSNIWYQWVDDPVVTTLSTISLPVEEIDFPAVTLCPQGSTESYMQTFVLVDGGWGSWESWGLCSLSSRTCQQSGLRHCDNPARKGNGLVCIGDGIENVMCNKESCDCEYFRLFDN